MAKIGMKYPIFAPMTEGGSTVTYSNAVVLAKAISADISITASDVKLYGDDGVAEVDKSFQDGTVTLDITDLSLENKALILGQDLVSAGIPGKPEIMKLVSKGDDTSIYGGLGFYATEQVNNVRQYRAYLLRKTKFSEPNISLQTKGETTTFGTPTLNGTIERDITGEWKEEVVVTDEGDAKAWLNDIVNLNEVNKDALSSVASGAESKQSEDYTSASWVAFANALAVAQAVLNADPVSQTTVDNAIQKLTDAESALVPRA